MKDVKRMVKPIGELSEQQLYVSFSKSKAKSVNLIELYNKGQSIIEKNGELKKITDSFFTKYQ